MLGTWIRRLVETPAAVPAADPTGDVTTPGIRFFTWDDVEADAAAVGYVSRERAEGLPGVGRGVQLVCTVLSQMFPHEVRNLRDPVKPLEVLPTSPVLRDPDPGWHGYPTWISTATADLQWHGNCFADKTADVDKLGYPLRLPLISAPRIDWARSKDPKKAGAKVYVVGPDPDDYGSGGGARKEVDPPDMMHAAVNVPPGKRMGRGIIDLYQQTLRLIVVVERATFVVMKDGKPAGMISTDADLDGAELAQVKQDLIAGVRRDGIGAMVRATFAQMSWNANDLTLIPAREYNLRLASDMVGVPPYLLGVPSESRVYSNAESEWSNFLKVTIARYQLPLQDALTRCVPRGRDVLLDTEDLNRPDAKTRWEVYQIAYGIVDEGSGQRAMTIAEIRQEERLGPLPEPLAPAQPSSEEDAA